MTTSPYPVTPGAPADTPADDADGWIQLTNDPAFMADPYPAYARWRAAGPVHRVRTPDGHRAWLLTRYDDVRTGLTNPALSLSKTNANPGNYGGFTLPPALDANLLNLDPPDHTRLRRLVTPTFTTERVQRLAPHVRRRAHLLLDAVAAGIADSGRADLIEEYAAPLTLATIGEIFGISSQDLAGFRTWTTALIAPDPAGPLTPRQAIAELTRFLHGLIEERRADPGDDLLSSLIAARDQHDRLTGSELTSLAFLLLWAGYENSLHLIGNAVLTLLQHSGTTAGLVSSETEEAGGLPSAAIEELLRYANPNQYAIRRFPTHDLTIHGTRIPAGDTVLLAIAATHRDPEHVPDPDALDLTRTANAHLAFGHGVHHCLGAPLARLHLGIAISALFLRIPDLALAIPAEQLDWRPSWRSRGLRALPIKTAAQAAEMS